MLLPGSQLPFLSLSPHPMEGMILRAPTPDPPERLVHQELDSCLCNQSGCLCSKAGTWDNCITGDRGLQVFGYY